MRVALFHLAGLSLLLLPLLAGAERLSVAVAANFLATLEQIEPGFEAATGHQLEISWGATGKLYLQITQGAPYQVFLSADAARPQRLEQDGLVLAGSRTTYARGCLALYSRSRPDLAESGESWLGTVGTGYLAIANPEVAPYGIAARQVLQNLGLWAAYQPRLVFGENVSQTFRYVVSSAAEAGFVARSQALAARRQWGGSYWSVPNALYSPIEQQMVLLAGAEGSVAATAFVAWMSGPEARRIIQQQGYGLGQCQ